MKLTNVTNITKKDFSIRIMVARHLDVNWMTITECYIDEERDQVYAEWNDEYGLQKGLFPMSIIQEQPTEDDNYQVCISNQPVKSYRVVVKRVSKRMTTVHLLDLRTGKLCYTIQYINGRVVSTFSAQHNKTYKTRFLNISFQRFPKNYRPLPSTTATKVKF